MNNIKIIFILFVSLSLLFQSCKVTDPYYTTVKKLYDVEPGMKFSKVNEILSAEPYDFYYNFNDNNMVYVYEYKHMYHKMTLVAGNPDKRNELYLNSGGQNFYKEPGKIYMEFDKDKKLVGFHTETGRKENINLLKHENTIREIEKDYTKYNRLNLDGSILEKPKPISLNTTINANNNIPSNNIKTKKVKKNKKSIFSIDKKYKKNSISLEYLTNGIVGLRYERLITKKISFQVDTRLRGFDANLKYHLKPGINTSSIGLKLFEYRTWESYKNIPDSYYETYRFGLNLEYRMNRYITTSLSLGPQFGWYEYKYTEWEYDDYNGYTEQTYWGYDSVSPFYVEFTIGAYLPF